MKVSVVIPAYNAERYVGQTIESVLGQTVSDWELIIVDDGSTDRTAAVACAYAETDARLRVVRQPNRGLAAARNRGFAATNSATDFVAFLDADDLLERRALEILAAALDDYPQTVAAHGLGRSIDENSQPCDPGELETWGRHRRGVVGRKLATIPPDAPTTLAILSWRNVIATPGGVLVRRWAAEAVGGFDSSTAPCEDWDMWLRLSLLGDFAYVDRVVIDWRKHGENMSADQERMIHGQSVVRRKLLALPNLSPHQRQIIRVAYRHRASFLCALSLTVARRSIGAGEFRQAQRYLGAFASECIRWAQARPTW